MMAANSFSRLSSGKTKRMYSPTFCTRRISSGLRMKATNGPFTSPRGPAFSSAAAFFWSSVIFSSGIAGMRSGAIWNRASLPVVIGLFPVMFEEGILHRRHRRMAARRGNERDDSVLENHPHPERRDPVRHGTGHRVLLLV